VKYFKKNIHFRLYKITLKDYTTLKTNFGLHIKKIRESKGYSLIDVDRRCELDESNISKMENGKINIQLSTIFELAKGLNVEPKDLLDFKY
jgi:transcriptional regulator with XRE-family HTH domain